MAYKYETIREVELSSLEEFEHKVSIPFKNWRGYNHMYYRGHADNSWNLTPSLFRNNEIGTLEKLNVKFTDEFMSIKTFALKADNIRIALPGNYFKMLNSERKDIDIEAWKDLNLNHLLELITVGQHYGVKTRFLDFTIDPHVALYFAAEGALNEIMLNGYDKNKYFCIWSIDSLALADQLEIKTIFAPTANNAYLNAQKGLFITQKKYEKLDGDKCYTFDIDRIIEYKVNLLAEENEGFQQYLPFILKLKFPYKIAGKIAWELRRKNYSYYTIRPNLENIQKEEEIYKKWSENVLKKYGFKYY